MATVVEQVKKVLDDNFEDYLKNNEIELEQNTEQIKQIQLSLKNIKKYFSKINNKSDSIINKRYYTSNIGVDIESLTYSVSKKRKSYTDTLVKIYEELNKLANLIKFEPQERDYEIYYQSEGQYYLKRLNSEDFAKVIGKRRRRKKNTLVGGKLTQLRKDLKQKTQEDMEIFKAQQAFSEHLNDFLNVLQSTVTLEPGELGFAYETFTKHMRYYGDSFEFDKNGYLIRFTPHTNGFDPDNIRRAFFGQKGQARWLTGGDVGLTQIKSMSDSSSFGVTSVEQIEVSFNNLWDIFFDGQEEKEKLSSQDIKRLVLFLNDFHSDIAKKESDEMIKIIEDKAIEVFKGLGFKVSKT